MGEFVTFRCPDGVMARGYRARPESARAGVVLLQEWWGINPQICSVADRLAGERYVVVVPDLYHGRVTSDEREANHLMTGLDWVGATSREVAGAVEYVRASAPRVGVMGFCMGGALSIIAGVRVRGCDAVVSYYGIPSSEQAEASALQVPFQGHFAMRDDWCTGKLVDDFGAAASETGAPVEIHRYEADHAFFNETRPSYDKTAATMAWIRTLKFLERYL